MNNSLVRPTISLLRNERLRELFLLERLHREKQLITLMEQECYARLDSLTKKERWNRKQEETEKNDHPNQDRNSL